MCKNVGTCGTCGTSWNIWNIWNIVAVFTFYKKERQAVGLPLFFYLFVLQPIMYNNNSDVPHVPRCSTCSTMFQMFQDIPLFFL